MKTVTESPKGQTDVIRMAREAGFASPVPSDGYMGLAYDYRDGSDTGGSLERFAALVREDEREKQQDHFRDVTKMVQEPVAWLCECSPQDWNERNADERSVVIWSKDSLRDYEADGYSITPFYSLPPTSALAARQMRDALVHISEYWNRDENETAMADALLHIIETADNAIAALPVPSCASNASLEVQWRDLRDVEIGYIYDDVSRTAEQEPTLIRFAKAVIAKFKEKQL